MSCPTFIVEGVRALTPEGFDDGPRAALHDGRTGKWSLHPHLQAAQQVLIRRLKDERQDHAVLADGRDDPPK